MLNESGELLVVTYEFELIEQPIDSAYRYPLWPRYNSCAPAV